MTRPTTSIICQAALIAGVVFILAIAGLMIVRNQQQRLPSISEGNLPKTGAQASANSEKSNDNDKEGTRVSVPRNDQQSPDEMDGSFDKGEHQKEEIDASMAKYTLWLMLFTGVLAVSTIFLAVATAGLWNYAAEQADDMKKSIAAAVRGANAARDAVLHSDQANELQLRAYVFVRLMLDSNVIPAETYGITYLIPNDGKTPAIDIKMFRKVGILPYPLPVGYVLPTEEFSGGVTMPPGAQPQGVIRTDTVFSDEDVRKITSDKSGFRLYFWGEATYTDVFGQKRWTKFCMSRPPEAPTVRGVIWEATAGYNEFH